MKYSQNVPVTKKKNFPRLRFKQPKIVSWVGLFAKRKRKLAPGPLGYAGGSPQSLSPLSVRFFLFVLCLISSAVIIH